MSVKVYQKVISNEYLGVEEEIKGAYPAEIEVKAKVQAARWARREKRQRERENIDFLRELAGYDTRQAVLFIEECKNILRSNLEAGKKLDLVSLYDDKPYPPFVFKEPAPRYKEIAREMGVPQKDLLAELFFPSIKKRRLDLEKKAKETFESRMQQFKESQEAARAAYEEKRAKYIEKQSEYNMSVDQLHLDLEKGLPEAVESSARIALALINCPDIIELTFDARYLPQEKLIIINCVFPHPWEIPRAVRYDYIEEENGITPLEMEQEEFSSFYKNILLQLTLSSIHILFESLDPRHIQQAAFNGLVKGPESGGTYNGAESESNCCILTCKVSRELFKSLDLAGASPEECFRAIKGVMEEPLTELTAVRPAVDMKQVPPAGPETGQKQAGNASPGPAAFRPGELTTMARELMADMVEKIETSLANGGRSKRKDMRH